MLIAQAALPTWFQMALGGGGLIGASALILGLVKLLTDAKDTDIRRLESTIARLESQHVADISSIKNGYSKEIDSLQRELESKKEELERIRDFRQFLDEAVNDLAREGITVETSASLRKIKEYLTTIEQSFEDLKSFKSAASWVKYKEEEWLLKITKSASEAYPGLVTQSKIAAFEKELRNYLQWLYDSLYFGFTCRIEDYVSNRTIEESFPYRAALKKLIELRDFGELSIIESQCLQTYIEELFRVASL